MCYLFLDFYFKDFLSKHTIMFGNIVFPDAELTIAFFNGFFVSLGKGSSP